MGLVQRTIDPQDRRAIQIRLTPRGYKLVDHPMRRLTQDQPEYKALEELGERELNSLNRLLRKLLLRFEQQADSRSDRRRRFDARIGE
jgi:DNA-binding MarR family transcriptional regulator